jgi:hypothetical protein
MVDGSKVGSMIVMVIIGIIIIILGGIVIWKYRQDQALIATLQANGTLTSTSAAQLPKAGWVYGLAGLQIVLGVILVIWGVAQYFAGSKHLEVVKEYASRALHSVAPTTVVEPVATMPASTAVPLETRTTYPPLHTGGSRRAVRVQ